MAGGIEEPFNLDFRVDSFGSGSISFGRFESEALCWERRSSFLHNRYLEEVEKCSKPGSVTEKKAYFEAHFRKKGFPLLSSPDGQKDDEFSEKEVSEMMCDDEEIDHTNASIQFDHGLDFNNITECETQGHKADDAQLAINFESGIQIKENLDCETVACLNSNIAISPFPDDHVNEGVSTVPAKNQQTSLPKKKGSSKLVPRVSPVPSRRYKPNTTSKDSVNKTNAKVLDDRVRSKAENKASGDPPKRGLSQKTKKYEGGSETKGVDKITSGEREVRSRSRAIVEPQRSTSQKVSSRAYQSADRIKTAVGASKPGTRQDISKSTTKEAVSSNMTQPQKQNSVSSIPGTRLSKSSRLSTQAGIVQTTATSASSSARTSKVKASQGGIIPAIGRKKEPEKENQIHKGKQKTIIERRSYAAFSNSSSRGGRMAVGVVA